MCEVWLRTNRRALALGILLPGAGLVVVIAALIYCLSTKQHVLLDAFFGVLALVLLWLIGGILQALARPRIAYESGTLLLFLDLRRATRVPIKIVECFFLGHGPSELPKLKGREPETKNIVIRLAEAASDWKHREVRPAFGQWCEGYITVRGSWCEPITGDLVRRLNQRLSQVHREAAANQESGA
ncbi:MAG TPA: hypothetical protein VGJ16_12460 [Pirellulales bacterium]|jgi:hypothetical protein